MFARLSPPYALLAEFPKVCQEWIWIGLALTYPKTHAFLNMLILTIRGEMVKGIIQFQVGEIWNIYGFFTHRSIILVIITVFWVSRLNIIQLIGTTDCSIYVSLDDFSCSALLPG